ncbi:MAG TPA: protein-L-isoaspartate(D-aspartate) O-methyltransferase [Candidatus Competibacteraceae bacterium]|nr:protein-L-isoaspartate(D-aspartate) O-methyltransferase [Candidatus Competibacteraceae bacterium]
MRILALLLVLLPLVAGAADFAAAREAMLREIAADVRETASHLDKEALDSRVMAALARVPRHEFVPADLQSLAYANRPLPIGHGQTISQPTIVAIMTDLLRLEPQHRVLEVGTGSGYQAAVLAELAAAVYTLEIIRPLGESARARLQRLGYDNVTVRVGDGYYGWEEHAPFDAIVVTAAASHVPPPLIRQLKPGGRMVIPVGSRFTVQELVLVEKDATGELRLRQILPVAFVPLTGGH